MKKLICLTRDFFTRNSYSINYHLLLLSDVLMKHSDYDVSVYSYETEPVLEQSEVLRYLKFSNLDGRVYFEAVTTMVPDEWIPRLDKADVILCQHYSFAEILKEIKAFRPKIRIVSWIHSIVQEEYLSKEFCYKNDIYPLLRLQNAQVSLSNLCIFDSQYDYNLGRLNFVHMGQTAIIHPVTEMADFREKRLSEDSYIFLEGNIELSQTELLFIGRWTYRKGLDSLIPCCFRMFMEHGVKTVLLTDDAKDYVFSDQAGKRQFRTLIQCGGLRFESWKPDKKEYAKFLCEKRRIAVFPSYYDPFNMAAYDCAALGIPLIVSNRCGVCEVLPSNKAVSVCNPYDTEDLYIQMLLMCTAACGPLPAPFPKYGSHEFVGDILKIF